jgi:hypothetical protein
MITIHVVRSGAQYALGPFTFQDIVGLVVYLRARGITQKNILKAIDILARDGEYTIKQA